ncbi:MAG: hypothetical protein ICV73_25965, partial [Acetobacteraceae bacterium]|nr:hypothetical protein [Acetobacteraceae bacterium]
MSVKRRALIAAAPFALSTGCAAAQPRAPAVPVRERFGALRLGANLERWFTIASNNHPRRLGRAWWRGFKGAGFDHVRLFITDVAYTGDGPGIAEMYREAAADAVSAG